MNGYVPNQPYNQRDQYQAHTTILEPADYDHESGVLKLNYRPFQLTSTSYGNPRFLAAMSAFRLPPIHYAANKFSWTYNARHTAQAVLPFLYVGPATAARDPSYLLRNGITMVIAVRSASSARAQPKLLDPSRFPFCANLQTSTFDVDGPYDIITNIRPVLKQMTDHLELHTQQQPINVLSDIGGRILVFCESGNERSPVLVAAYLMLLYGISWHESLNLIHAFRFSVCLNSSMNEMLKTWQGLLQAESDTAAASTDANMANAETGVLRGTGRSNKRSIDDAYDSDDTMTDEHEVAVRTGIAPFVDGT